MDDLSYKVRIAVLWILFMVTFFAYRTMALSVDAQEVSLLGNSDCATFSLVIMLFTLLTLTVRSRTNRTINMIASGVFFGVQVIMLVDGMLGYASEPFNWMTGASLAIMALVFWFASKWPKQLA